MSKTPLTLAVVVFVVSLMLGDESQESPRQASESKACARLSQTKHIPPVPPTIPAPTEGGNAMPELLTVLSRLSPFYLGRHAN